MTLLIRSVLGKEGQPRTTPYSAEHVLAFNNSDGVVFTLNCQLMANSLTRDDWLNFQYVDEEDLMNAIKGFSSVTKEHTTFTDTHL